MTTNLDIIKRGLKKIHVLAAGTEPTSVQAAAGMAMLQSLIVELIGQGSLGRLNDVLATTAYTARENDRITASAGVTVTLPLTITQALCDQYLPSWYGFYGPGFDYGAAYTTLPRPPRNLAPVVVLGSNYTIGVTAYTAPSYWFFNGYSGAWVPMEDLTQQGTFPFPAHLENGFAAMLAEPLVDDYSQDLGQQTAKQAAQCRMTLSLKMDSRSSPTRAQYF